MITRRFNRREKRTEMQRISEDLKGCNQNTHIPSVRYFIPLISFNLNSMLSLPFSQPFPTPQPSQIMKHIAAPTTSKPPIQRRTNLPHPT